MANKGNIVKTKPLTEEQKRDNTEYWVGNLLNNGVTLSAGVRSAFGNCPRPEPVKVTDKQMAIAVNNLEDRTISFVPSDETSQSSLSYCRGEIARTATGPFRIIPKLFYDRGLETISNMWMLQDGSYHAPMTDNNPLVKKLVYNLHLGDWLLPFKIVSLPTPYWVENKTPCFCLESEYEGMLIAFIRPLVVFKIPKQ